MGQVGFAIAFLLHGHGKDFVQHAQSLAPLIEQAADEFNLDPVLITVVIFHESTFRRYLKSPDGKDLGLMQLRRTGCLEPYRGISDVSAMNPAFNIRRGTRCLADAVQACRSVAKGLSKYNARGCRRSTYSDATLDLLRKIRVRIAQQDEVHYPVVWFPAPRAN